MLTQKRAAPERVRVSVPPARSALWCVRGVGGAPAGRYSASAVHCDPVSEQLPFRYLAVDGPIGVGKTTLVELLARRFEGVKLLEDAENPFLGAFYRDQPGAGFQTELYFLLTRYQQQQTSRQPELLERLLLADYTFPKNRIFAYMNLSDDELSLFDKLYLVLEQNVPPPDLVLYLAADLPTCMARIRKRQRAYEKQIAEDYIAQLIDAYNHYYYHYARTPLLVVDTRYLDFEQREEDFAELVNQLRRPIRGTEYFVPVRMDGAR